MAKETKIEMKVDKECKGSRRYAAGDPDAPIATVYVNRPFSNDRDTVTITVE